MKPFCFFLILLFFIGTPLLYLFFPIPVEKVTFEGTVFPTNSLKDDLCHQSFVLARLPQLPSLKEIDPGLKRAELERFFPFELRVRWIRYEVLLACSYRGKAMELLDNGDFVENPYSRPTVTASTAIFPWPQEIKKALATLFMRIPDKLLKSVVALEVESSGRIVLQLNDGLKCYFSPSNLERHLPYVELYVNTARKDGKKELHFEFSEVYAK